MILTEIQKQYGPKQILFEAKSRIEHPEDLVCSDGSLGAKSAVNSLLAAATTPKLSQIKWDGAPAGIAGRVHGKFTLTDKKGFAKYDMGGLPMSEKDLYNMMFDRFPGSPGRDIFSKSFAGLFPLLDRALPVNFKGFIQFDVLWFTRPIQYGKDDNRTFKFKPNKINYSVPVNSEMGIKIANSQMGIVVHSYFNSPLEMEPIAITDLKELHLNPSPGLVILGPTTVGEKIVPSALKPCRDLLQFINSKQTVIDAFLNKTLLSSLKITDLGSLLKSFLANLASQGKKPDKNITFEFKSFLDRKVSKTKAENIKKYLLENKAGYLAICKIILATVMIKNIIKHEFDKVPGNITASLNGIPGHEGFVSSTPYGKIKLVDRPTFMRHL